MNRVILITGATGVLGSSIAEHFLNNNDIVYLNYLHNEKKAKEYEGKYKNARAIKCDVGNEEEVKRMIELIEQEQGHLDILVNNAAITMDNEFFDKTKAEFSKVLETNLVGPFLTSKYAGLLMQKNNSGTIINISSTNAIDTNEPYGMDYDASKAGLISLTHNFAAVLAPNIRVNAIASGWINTPLVMEMNPHYIEEEKKKIMMERFAEPEEIAKIVFFLASDDASYINNSVIRVDGGKKC